MEWGKNPFSVPHLTGRILHKATVADLMALGHALISATEYLVGGTGWWDYIASKVPAIQVGWMIPS